MQAALIGVSWMVLTAVPLAAQEGRPLPAELRDGRRSLSFAMFTGGGTAIGLGFMMSSRTAFTLDLQADASIGRSEVADGEVVVNEREDWHLRLAVAPGFRRYMAGRGDVASYVAGRLLLGVDGASSATTTRRARFWAPRAGTALGFGLEWFVTDAMSLRGEAVVDAAFRYSHRTADPDGSEDTSWRLDAGLGQSALALSIWF